MLNKAMPAGRQGFTLLEAIISIFIVTMGVGAVFALVNQTIGGTQIISSKLTATYLAQEGIESIREIRDSNFLKIHKGVGGVNWDTGIVSSGLTDIVFMDGTANNFKRKITITPDGINILNVSVEVSWQERGGPHKVIVQENLYKWLQ